MKGRFLLHFSHPNNWRLRNPEKHPLDPGWEVGTYSVCHKYIRAKLEIGTTIFDVAKVDGNGVIRSVFTASRAKGSGEDRVLYFDEFYFADNEPIRLPDPYIQYRQMRMETFIKKYHEQILNNVMSKYTKYPKGSRPVSLDPTQWNDMVAKSAKTRKERSDKASRAFERI